MLFAREFPTNEFEIVTYSLVSSLEMEVMLRLTLVKRIPIKIFITSKIMIVFIVKIKISFFQNPNFINHYLNKIHFFEIFPIINIFCL